MSSTKTIPAIASNKYEFQWGREVLFLSDGLQEVRCLIADIRMPGMSGLDFQSHLNAEDYQIPIIFMTAHGDETMRIRAMRDGAVAVLEKPFDNSDLLNRVRVCLNVTQDEK